MDVTTIRTMKQERVKFLAEFDDCFCRRGSRRGLQTYVNGQLSDLPRKSIEPMALSDHGAPSYDHALAAKLCAMSVPSFACTPDVFPDLMAAAIQKRDIQQWVSERQLNLSQKPS